MSGARLGDHQRCRDERSGYIESSTKSPPSERSKIQGENYHRYANYENHQHKTEPTTLPHHLGVAPEPSKSKARPMQSDHDKNMNAESNQHSTRDEKRSK